MSPWLGMVLPLQNGWWEVLGMALDSQEQRLQAGLRGSHLLFLVTIKACGSGCLSGTTGCKHEKTSRGVAAPETPEKAGDRRGCLSLIPGNSTGYCALSHMLPLKFQAHLVTLRNKCCYCSPGAQQRSAPSTLPAPGPVRASEFPFRQGYRLE